MLSCERERLGRRASTGSHRCRLWRLRRGRDLSAVGAYHRTDLWCAGKRRALRERSVHHGATSDHRAMDRTETLRRTRYRAHGVWRAGNRAPELWRTWNRAQEVRRTRNAVRIKWRGWRTVLEDTVTLRRHRENCREGWETGASPSKRRSGCLWRGALRRIEIHIRIHCLITSLFPCVGNDR